MKLLRKNLDAALAELDKKTGIKNQYMFIESDGISLSLKVFDHNGLEHFAILYDADNGTMPRFRTEYRLTVRDDNGK